MNYRAGYPGSPSRGLGKVRKREDVDPVWAPHTLTEAYDSSRNPEFMARMYEESAGVENMAGDEELASRAKMACMAARKSQYSHREFLNNKFLVLYRLYRGETLNEYDYGRLQIHSPEPFKIVETIHPRMMRALFGSERWFQLTAEQAEHDKNAMAQEALCRDQLLDGQFIEVAEKFIRNALIYGTAFQKTFWKQEIAEVKFRKAKKVPHDRIPGATKIELEEAKQMELVHDSNVVMNVDIYDFFASPSADSIEDAEWCGDRSLWTAPEVQRMGEFGHWKNLDKLEDRAGADDETFGDEYKERRAYTYGLIDPRETAAVPHIPTYEVEDWYIPLDVKIENGRYETKLCNVVVIDPDGMHVIARITENPFWHRQKPYQAYRPIALQNELYGIGPIEHIARLSREKDLKRQLGMAAAQLEANPMWLVSDEANVPMGQLTIEPGMTFRVPNVQNSIAPLYVPKVSQAAYEAERILTQDIRETAGTTSPSMGAVDPGSSSKTATQHTSEIDQTNMRISNMVLNYEQQVIRPMLHQMVWNNQQFQSYARVVRDFGPLGVGFQDRFSVSPEDLVGRFRIIPLASFRLTTRQTQVQQLINVLDRAPVINQMYGPSTVNMPKLLAHILDKGFDIRDVDEFISVPNHVRLLTTLEEHEMWYNGHIPPVRDGDNDLRHFMDHMDEIGSERFAWLKEHDPAHASRILKHIAGHGYKIAKTKDRQEYELMQAMQEAIRQNIMPPGVEGIRMDGTGLQGQQEGYGSPTQQPGSPNFRSNEVDRTVGPQGNEQRAESGMAAPNLGAQ
jgi:hypothetical protein